MQKEFLKGVEAMNKTTIESVKRFAELQGRMLERVSARQVDIVTDYLESGVRQLQMLGEVKDLQAAVAAQSKLAADMGEKFVAHAKKNADAFEATKSDLTAWFEEGLKQAAENPLAKQVAAKKAA